MADSRVAVVGATGAVGRTMVSILEDRDFPLSELRLLASSRSAGQKVSTRWGEVEIEDLANADPGGVEIALFSAGGQRSKDFAPAFAAAGAVVVDNSSAFRMDPGVPLVVANVNDHSAAGHDGIIANPNCTTMALMMAAGPLHRHAGLSRMVAMSYQSVSGSGMAGMDALLRQTEALMVDREALATGRWNDPGADMYQRPIAFNVVPLAGSITMDDHTDEEWKLVHETRKILGRSDIAVEPSCVRVPVMVGHGISATMWFDEPIDPGIARDVLADAHGIELWGDEKWRHPSTAPGPTRSWCRGSGARLARRAASACGSLATTFARVQR